MYSVLVLYSIVYYCLHVLLLVYLSLLILFKLYILREIQFLENKQEIKKVKINVCIYSLGVSGKRFEIQIISKQVYTNKIIKEDQTDRTKQRN